VGRQLGLTSSPSISKAAFAIDDHRRAVVAAQFAVEIPAGVTVDVFDGWFVLAMQPAGELPVAAGVSGRGGGTVCALAQAVTAIFGAAVGKTEDAGRLLAAQFLAYRSFPAASWDRSWAWQFRNRFRNPQREGAVREARWAS